MWTGLGAIAFVVLGFFVGGLGSAWMTRNARAEPWRKIKVEHEGTDGVTTRTRLVFANPKLPLQAIEVIRSPEGKPQTAHVALKDGTALTAEFEKDKPISLEGPKGRRALFSFKGEKARVAFFDAKGKEAGEKVVRVPVELLSALKLAAAAPVRDDERHAAWSLVPEAQAQEDPPQQEEEEEDPQINVQRHVEVSLDITTKKDKDAGKALIEANCEPFTCLALTKEVSMPGESKIRIAVSGSKKKSELDEPKGGSALEPFKKSAKEERKTATRVLPDVNAVVAAVSVTAIACRSLKLKWSLCVAKLGKDGATAGAAILSVSDHEVETAGREVDKRAEALYFEEQARAALDDEATIEICVSRDGFARACTKVSGRPLGEKPMKTESARVELRRGIGGTLVGSFVMTQSDGGGCKFSPSPKTSGPLKMSFDSETGVLTASLKAEAKGTRSNLRCNLGSANMRWTQNYSVTVTQTFTPEQLSAGGKLPLEMKGTMKGTGSYSFSNCRSNSGVSGNCPAGKREPYSHPLELTGELDLDTQRGNGRLTVRNAPLSTRGTWQIPAGGTP